jgi:prolyl 4-hydroxylase
MTARPLSDAWAEWLQANLARGCNPRRLFFRVAAEGFDLREISRQLDGFFPQELAAGVDASGFVAPPPARKRRTRGPVTRVDGRWRPATNGKEPWHSLYHAPLTRKDFRPRAWKIDTDEAQLYEIPDFLDAETCRTLTAAIDVSLTPSTVTRGPADYRMSSTCFIRRTEPELARELDARIAALIGVDPAWSEPIQGQRYDPGGYFKAHKDFFAPNTPEFDKHTRSGGQRTWTVMIYLNEVEEGGGTRFEAVGRTFRPVPGLAVAWNNLTIDGTPNHGTMHEALPVVRGVKYVITKWFRELPGRND